MCRVRGLGCRVLGFVFLLKGSGFLDQGSDFSLHRNRYHEGDARERSRCLIRLHHHLLAGLSRQNVHIHIVQGLSSRTWDSSNFNCGHIRVNLTETDDKVVLQKSPYKFVNLIFMLVIIKDKLANLCGN